MTSLTLKQAAAGLGFALVAGSALASNNTPNTGCTSGCGGGTNPGGNTTVNVPVNVATSVNPQQHTTVGVTSTNHLSNTNYSLTSSASMIRLGDGALSSQATGGSNYFGNGSLSPTANGGNVRFGDGALSPTSTSSSTGGSIHNGAGSFSPTSTSRSEGGDASTTIREGALSPTSTSSTGAVTQNLSIIQPKQNPGSYAPTINVAPGNGCYPARWGFSLGTSAASQSFSAGFTPGQELDMECEQGIDRRLMLASPDSLTQAIGLRASIEKFDGIRKGFEHLKGHLTKVYAAKAADPATGTPEKAAVPLPNSGAAILLGLAGAAPVAPPAPPAPQEGPKATASVTVINKDGTTSVIECKGKWDPKTMTCQPG